MESNSQGPFPRVSDIYKEKIEIYKTALEQDEIDIDVLRDLSFKGIPDDCHLRSLYWKIFLNYLPLNKASWTEHLQSSRNLYQTWKDELILDPAKFAQHSFEDESVHDVTNTDHPLCTTQTSRWNTFFQDKELLNEIDKDVRRTFPHLHFFNYDVHNGETKHYQAIRRILFVYAKLNPGISYVQGMNEVLAPIYYTMIMDASQEWATYAEEDSFFCFTNVMSEIRDNFCTSLDSTELGIRGTMARVNKILKGLDYELWNNLECKKIDPQFYSFRWLTLLCSQEFELPEVLRLWDSFFSDPQRFDFLSFFCCAMLLCARDKLLAGVFADNLKLLQKYPTDEIPVQTVLAEAVRLRAKYPIGISQMIAKQEEQERENEEKAKEENRKKMEQKKQEELEKNTKKEIPLGETIELDDHTKGVSVNPFENPVAVNPEDNTNNTNGSWPKYYSNKISRWWSG